MRKMTFLFLITLVVLGHGGFSQNSPFSVNNQTGQSVTNLTSTVGYGAILKIQRFSNSSNYYAFETGAGSNDDFRLHINNNWSVPLISFKPTGEVSMNGKVGIGTATPLEKLHIEGNIYLNNGSLLINQTAGSNAKFYFKNLGNYEWDLGMESSDATRNFYLYNRSNDTYPITVSKTNVPTFKSDKIRLEGMAIGGGNIWEIKCRDIIDNDFGVYSVSQASYRLYINNLGNVGIGTINPTQKLTVKGTIYSSEVKVDINAGTGPDYVFEPTYTLPSLDSVQSYINQNKHLPEVPSAKEMEANGVNLGEMNMLLLKKVEELTLYVIELKKENSEFKKELKKIANKN